MCLSKGWWELENVRIPYLICEHNDCITLAIGGGGPGEGLQAHSNNLQCESHLSQNTARPSKVLLPEEKPDSLHETERSPLGNTPHSIASDEDRTNKMIDFA